MSASMEEARRVTAGLKTKSDKIRALHRAGWSRVKIADALKIRYQHVRNVLVQDEARAARAAIRPSDQSTTPKPAKIRLGPDGRVVIPAAFRDALDLREGDILFARIESDEIHLLTSAAAMRCAQAIVRQFVPEGISLVDELIEDRRREVEREAGRG
jgi:AbrB family looped-hinge helix DNA binding protein